MADTVTKTQMLNNLRAVATRAKSAIEAAIEALPTEMFLDQAKTKFIPSFAFSETTYPGAANPNLNGKPVLVLAVKGVDNADPSNTAKQTTTYSFLDVSTLVDTYKAADGDSSKILTINGYTITVNVSAEEENILEVKNDGLYVPSPRVKNAKAGNVAGLDANGNFTDSGIAAANILTTADVPNDAEVTAMLNEVFGAAS